MNTAYKLVVVHPFADFKRGDVINDNQLINELSDPGHEHKHKVVKVLNENSEQTISVATINDSQI